MNFYNVTISQDCKKGPRELFSFVVKSESNQHNVYTHYINQYQHLNVRVDEIGDVKSLELPKENHNKPVDSVIDIANVTLTADEKKMFEAWRMLRIDMYEKERSIADSVSKRIKQVFGSLINSVQVDVVPDTYIFSQGNIVSAKITLVGQISDGLKLFEKMTEPTEAEVANEKEI